MIEPGVADSATDWVASSNANKSVADPAPIPESLVGVLTLRKIIWASDMHLLTSVEKNKFGGRVESSGSPFVF